MTLRRFIAIGGTGFLWGLFVCAAIPEATVGRFALAMVGAAAIGIFWPFDR